MAEDREDSGPEALGALAGESWLSSGIERGGCERAIVHIAVHSA